MPLVNLAMHEVAYQLKKMLFEFTDGNLYLRLMFIIFVLIMCYTPFTYTDFSYESLRIAQIHGSFTDPYEFATFTADLRVVTSYYELFTVRYGLLRVITIYLRQNSTICYELSRIPTSNLRVSNDLLTCCYE